jgi:hypothetical protein
MDMLDRCPAVVADVTDCKIARRGRSLIIICINRTKIVVVNNSER